MTRPNLYRTTRHFALTVNLPERDRRHDDEAAARDDQRDGLSRRQSHVVHLGPDRDTAPHIQFVAATLGLLMHSGQLMLLLPQRVTFNRGPSQRFIIFCTIFYLFLMSFLILLIVSSCFLQRKRLIPDGRNLI